jgi:DNA-binding transcriptional ArsR family regulator
MTLEEYIKDIPTELRKAIGGLDNEIRLGIIMALRKHGELSFSELSEKLGMKEDKAKIDFHLGKLTESGLVEHKFRHQLGNEKFSFYASSKFGENFWNNVVSSLKPPSPILETGISSGEYQINSINTETSYQSTTISDNPSVSLIGVSRKQTKRKLPERFSDQVIYGEATVKVEE